MTKQHTTPPTATLHVHFDDSTIRHNSSGHLSSRPPLPKSPYPEPLKLHHEKPDPTKTTSQKEGLPITKSTHLTPASQAAAGPTTLCQPGLGPFIDGQHPLGPPPAYQQTSFQPGSPMASNRRPIAGIAGPYENAMPPKPGAVSYQPQVPDTTNGPEVHWYMPRHDGTFPQAPGFGSKMANLQPFQSFQPVAAPFPGQPPIAMPIQQFVSPLQPTLIQHPAAESMMMQPFQPPAMFQAGMQPVLPQPTQPLLLQNGPHQQQGMLAVGAGGPNMLMGASFPDAAFGVGLTATEVAVMNNEYAAYSNVDEPQEFQPADPDPTRMYRVRDFDGSWAMLSRNTIDRGPFRWYVTDSGVFYAVRLAD